MKDTGLRDSKSGDFVMRLTTANIRTLNRLAWALFADSIWDIGSADDSQLWSLLNALADELEGHLFMEDERTPVQIEFRWDRKECRDVHPPEEKEDDDA